MQHRQIGNDTVGTVEVGAIGLGAMAFDLYGVKSRDRIVATVRAALDAGVTLIDTADAYGPSELGPDAQGVNETLVSSILAQLGVRDQVVVATKGGHLRTDGGGWDVNSSPGHLRQAVDGSLSRLGVDQIDIYQHHRPDPCVPYHNVLLTMREIFDSGKVRMIGISNANPQQIRQAQEILGTALVSVQNQFSPRFRSSQTEIDVCDELGLAFLPWSPLGGITNAADLAEHHPAFAEVAAELGVSPQQVTLAWELAQSSVVIPIPGASRPQSISDSAAAADLALTEDQLARLDKA
ncbi:MAG: aldo/keto reductase [Actinomycetota bacterium]